MYENHFKLDNRPFSEAPNPGNAYAHPQYQHSVAAVRRALLVPDAIVSIIGPAGIGKTTFVDYALQEIARQGDANLLIVRVSRIRTTGSDLIAHLSGRLGIDPVSPNTSQAFFDFRRRLRVLHKAGKRIVFVIEDGARLGTDLLAEIEAMTAADTGSSVAAAVMLMGGEALQQCLEDRDLARLRQRIRQRIDIEPLAIGSLRKYLENGFAAASGSVDDILAPDVADLLLSLSRGIPRVVNNLLESALLSSAGSGAARVTTEALREVAKALLPRTPVVSEEIPPESRNADPSGGSEQPQQAADNDVPEWEKEPTLAELRPDLDALEQAFNTLPVANDPTPQSAEDDATPVEADTGDTVPEITLDAAIHRRIERKQAEVVQSAPAGEVPGATETEEQKGDTVSLAVGSTDDGTVAATQELEKLPEHLEAESDDGVPEATDAGVTTDSADPDAGPSEDQPDATMTQTLRALNVSPPITDDDFGDEEVESSGSFFKRLKR